MPRTRVVAVLIGLLALIGSTITPAVAKPRPALPMTVIIQGLSGQRAPVRITGPADYDRTFRISDRRRFSNLRPGTYRLRARAVGTATPNVANQRVRINRKRGVRVFFRYTVPAPPTPPTPEIPGPVTNLRATAITATSITLAWTDPTTGFDGVRVSRTGGPGTLSVNSSQDGLTDNQLLPNTAYTYTLTTVGSAGDGPTASLTVTTLRPGIVASGNAASCAVNQAGTLTCWGTGPEAGVGSPSSTTAAPVVSPLSGQAVSAVARGTNHTCAISNGTVFCWGDNASGQIGNGSSGGPVAAPTPVTLPAGPTGVNPPTRAVAISAGATRSCAIADNAMLYCWGTYGAGTSPTAEYVPIVVDSAQRGVLFVGSSGDHTCVVTTNNQISCFGNAAPAVVPGTSGVYSGLAVGTSHACALSSTGVATCWGDNTAGQLGDGTNTPSATPVTVAGGRTFRVLEAGASTSCGINGAGAGFCWGGGGSGQLGQGVLSSANTPQPVQVPTGSVLTAISAGDTSCAVDNGVRAFCWGVGALGQLGNGSTSPTSSVPVQVVGYP